MSGESSSALHSRSLGKHITGNIAAKYRISKSNINRLPNMAILSALVLFGAAAVQAASVPQVARFFDTGPGLGERIGNPSILQWNDEFYVFSTGHDPDMDGENITFVATAVSDHLNRGWAPGPDAFANNPGLGIPGKNVFGSWTCHPEGKKGLGIWAPDVSQLSNGKLIMYYAANKYDPDPQVPDHCGSRCIGVAYADHPLGPWDAKNDPIRCAAGGAIDPDGIAHAGNRYLLWKEGSHVNPTISIWQMDPSDGKTPLTNQPKVLLDPEPDAYYGYEGPALIQMPDDRWALLHTNGQAEMNYTIHYAVSDNGIMGDYKSRGLLLGNGTSPNGNGDYVEIPGGPDFVGNSSTDFVFFGRQRDGPSRGGRLYFGVLEYTNNRHRGAKMIR